MKTVTTTASLHLRDAETVDEPASGAGTKGPAWRGGGAVGPLWDVLVTPPRAVQRPRKEPASSHLMATEPRTRVRGETFDVFGVAHVTVAQRERQLTVLCCHSLL